MVDKGSLPYEILSIHVSDTHMQISGWAFISYRQHFDSSSDHATQIEFVSLNHHFIVNAHLTSHSKTDLMAYFGSPTCSNSSINQAPEVCNYRYEATGFVATIPLEWFRTNETYQTNLIVHAYTAGLSFKTPVFYPMHQDLVFSKNHHQYRFVSKLDDTSLKVNATTVIVRKQAGKAGEIWYLGSNCSGTYLNQLFYQKDTFYHNVFEKILLGDTSYYRLAGKLSVCSNSRRRIIEGDSISPIWIASPYVLYSGSPLQIQVTALNQRPYFVGDYIELFLNEPLIITNHIKAFDLEDGELTHKIIVSNNTYQNQVGAYTADLSVVDSGLLSSYKTIQIRVLPLPNDKPMLFAYDQTLMQYDTFYPLKNVSAYDKEDGDLTDQIKLSNTIDTSILGVHQQCYFVYDSQFERTDKCIHVKVLSYTEMVTHFRFVSKNYLFYHESVPTIWLDKLFILDHILFSHKELNSYRISALD